MSKHSYAPFPLERMRWILYTLRRKPCDPYPNLFTLAGLRIMKVCIFQSRLITLVFKLSYLLGPIFVPCLAEMIDEQLSRQHSIDGMPLMAFLEPSWTASLLSGLYKLGKGGSIRSL